ncbi:hypothetical protein [Pararhizobium antarcticum]|uniref:Uncharacterized protein n=1 Tax=Pararhizobium antarcticum TaxID=1798805 RepID=A0A657LU70_9HYPH|nr:hypothetical protein [Pararhizobium antarcticum]OJF97573.1 hypothetical protein AX760_16550 [Pararhizobium antarcticum]
MQRRDILRSAVAFTVGAPAVMGAATAYDPIISAIQAYKDGCVAFCAVPEDEMEQDEENVIARTYGAPMEILENWDQPAMTQEGAIVALRLMRDEHLYIDGFGGAMFAAALAYFEQNS